MLSLLILSHTYTNFFDRLYPATQACPSISILLCMVKFSIFKCDLSSWGHHAYHHIICWRLFFSHQLITVCLVIECDLFVVGQPPPLNLSVSCLLCLYCFFFYSVDFGIKTIPMVVRFISFIGIHFALHARVCRGILSKI